MPPDAVAAAISPILTLALRQPRQGEDFLPIAALPHGDALFSPFSSLPTQLKINTKPSDDQVQDLHLQLGHLSQHAA